MSQRRIKILRKAYLERMKYLGASVDRTRGTWKRFKQAYNRGLLTPLGQLILPKRPSFKRRRVISMTEVTAQ